MAKRDKKVITLGSGEIFIEDAAATNAIPTAATLASWCTDERKLGEIKGGATLGYTANTYKETDDLGFVAKIITTDENAELRLGLITWNGDTLKMLIDRCAVTTDSTNHYRITKIGGAGNAQGKNYVLVFRHKDPVDGDVYIVIVGKNTAGATLAFATTAGTNVEPTFTAIPTPGDANGTLITMYEQIPAA